MNWKLFDIDGTFLQLANCQYDACDISVMLYNAKSVLFDFEKREARILTKE